MRRAFAVALAALLFASLASAQVIDTFAGGGPNNIPATAANLAFPGRVAVDSGGNVYVTAAARVFKVDSSGTLTVVAGTGIFGFSGDGGPATNASLRPSDIALDASDNLFIAEQGNGRVRRVDAATGLISSVVVGGTPNGIAVLSNGKLVWSDNSAHVVRRLDVPLATVVAGTGVAGFSGDGGPANIAQLFNPFDVAVDASDNIYIADLNNRRIRKVSAATGQITTVAGNGTFCNVPSCGDNGPAINAGSGANSFQTVTVDAFGNIFIGEQGNNLVRRVDGVTGIITTVAGVFGGGSFSGDGGMARLAHLNIPVGVAFDAAGNLYVADSSNNRVRRVTPGVDGKVTGAADEIISTFAGNGSANFSGDGFAAMDSAVNQPGGAAVDNAGNLFFSDFGNRRVRRVDAVTGIISTYAGNGVSGFSGDGGLATSAALNAPLSIGFDSANNLYIPDNNNQRIRRVDAATGVITTVAGNGLQGFGGDGGPATDPSVRLNFPQKVIVDSLGNLYFSDFSNSRIRKVAGGIITTFAGTGASAYNGDGIPATTANLNGPLGIALDSAGNLYVAEINGGRVRKVDTSGMISTIAGTGVSGFSGDGGPATSAQLNPWDIAVDSARNIFIAESNNQRIRRVDAVTHVITTVAGTGVFGFSGDGGSATLARLANPRGVALDASGRLFIGDLNNNRIRRVVFDATPPVITPTVTGTLGNNSWHVSNVAVSWSVTDAESAISSTSGCGTSNVTSDTAGVTFTCSATSAGGTASQSVTIKRDATPPTIQATTTPGSPAASGWYNIATGAPTVSYSCQDDTSGLDGPCPSPVTPGNGANQSFTGNISDQAGNPASVTVSGLSVDLTAPVIAAHGDENAEATSASGASVTYSNPTASDGTSGTGPIACLLASASVFGLGNTTVTCNASDSAGNLATATTFVVHVVDTTPPDTSITAHPNPITNVASPSFSFEGTDTVTPPASLSFECSLDSGPWAACTSPAAFGPLTDGAHEFRVRTKDGAGNVDPTPAFFMWTIDTAPPVITSARTPAPNANGWNNTDVTVTFTCTDAGSGVGTPPISPQVVSAEGAGQSVSASCTDNAGNSASATVSGINIDKTPPSITIVALVNGATFLLNQAAAASYTCNGGLSGIATCAGPVANGANMNMSSPGSKTFTVNATDGAGNTASLTNSYTVLYSFIGFLQPIDNLPVINEAKAGKTIPVKWQLKDANGNYVSDLGSMVSLLSGPIACDAAPTTIVEEQLSSPGSTVFRYDSTANQFVFNWQSASNWKGCRLLQLTLSDGTQQYAKFNFK